MEEDRVKTHQARENELGLKSFSGSCISPEKKTSFSFQVNSSHIEILRSVSKKSLCGYGVDKQRPKFCTKKMRTKRK